MVHAKLVLFFFFAISFSGMVFLNLQIPPYQGLDYYYILLLALCVVIMTLLLREENSASLFSSPGFLFFLILGGALRYYKLNEASIWLDEYTQYLTSWSRGPVSASSAEQQMPLDYILSAISKYFFDFIEFGPRFFSTLAGSLSCGMFYLLAQKILGKNYFSLTAALSFSIAPWMIRYSVEGRPISLTVLAGIVFFYILWDFFVKKSPNLTQSYLALSGATFFLLSSTFFQNFIFLFSVNVAFILVCKPNLKQISKILVSQLIPLLLLAPNIWGVLSHQSSSHQINSFELSTLLSPHGKPNTFTEVISSTVFSLKGTISSTVFFLVLLAALLIVRKKKPSFEICVVLSSTLIFISVFSLSYFILVNWQVYHRYSLISFPLIILSIFLVITELIRITHTPVLKSLLHLLVIIFLGNSAFGLYNYHTQEKELDPHADWRSTYRVLNQYAKDEDIVLTARYDNYKVWRPSGVVAQEFYLKKSLNLSLLSSVTSNSQIVSLREVLKKNIHPKAVFIIHFWNEGYQTYKIPKGLFLFSFNQLAMMGSKAEEQWELTALKLIRTSREIGPLGQKHLTLLQLEMEILIHLNRRHEAQQVFNQLLTYDIKTYEPKLFNYYSDWLSSD